MSPQFHGGILCSEAGPLVTSHSIALTFSWWPRYRTHCSLLAGKHIHTSLLLFHTPPTPTHSVIPLAGKQRCKGRKSSLCYWMLQGLHLMYMASIDHWLSIMLAWHSVRDFLASLHVFLIFMVTGINAVSSTNIIAGNHFDISNLKLPPLKTLLSPTCVSVMFSSWCQIGVLYWLLCKRERKTICHSQWTPYCACQKWNFKAKAQNSGHDQLYCKTVLKNCT